MIDAYAGVMALMAGGAAGLLFLMLPASNVLNVVTVPLGYEWQSCPYCPAFGMEKLTRAECAECGEEHVENWGSSIAVDDERLSFCDYECRETWGGACR